MSALYLIDYQGVMGAGHATVYIGKGILLGADITGSRYKGSVVAQGSHLVGNASLTSAGAELVTGQVAPPGTVVPISFNLPTNFDDGSFHTISVGGQPVNIRFTKIGDIP